MLTLENMAVHFTEDGDQQVILAFKNIANASTESRAVITRNLEAGGEGSEHFLHRLEHMGIQSAFVFSSMAEGGERGLTLLGHSLAAFGFMFQGWVGIITTGLAVFAEHFLTEMQKAREEAEKTEKALVDLYRTIGESGSILQAAKRAQQLYSGDVFATGDTPLDKLIRGGGIEAANAKLATLKASLAGLTRPDPGSPGFDVNKQEAYNTAVNKLGGEITQVTADLKLLNDQHALYTKLITDESVKESALATTTMNTLAAKAAQQKEIRDHEIAIRQAQSAGDYAKELALTIAWVDRMAAEYTKDSDQYAKALEAKRTLEDKGNKDLDKIRADNFKNAVDSAQKALDDRVKAEQDSYLASQQAAQRAGDALNVIRVNDMERAAHNAESFRQKQMAAAQAFIEQYEVTAAQKAGILGDAITNGFEAAFAGKGLSGAFKAFGDTIFAGLGGILKRLGQTMMQAGMATSSLLPLLSNFFTSGPAMIAAGAILVALGASLSSIATGGGGSSGGGGGAGTYSSGPTSTTGYAYVAPYAAAPGQQGTTQGMSATTPVVVNATIIGKDDPGAQRQIMELVRNAQLRQSY